MGKETTDISQQRINIREIFMEKNPRVAKILPGFVYSYLDRILHVDFINYFLEKHGHKYGPDFATASVEEFNIHKEIVGFDHLPDTKNIIFASNHPLGGFDGMLLISILSEKYPGLKVLVNDILTNIKNMDDVFVPINKHGKQSIEAVKRIDRIFSEEIPVLTFPAGMVSRKQKGVIRDTEWKKNFIAKAFQYKKIVVPVHVSGRCSNFFYRLANFRKFLGIKANIEMFYLPDESYKHRNEHIRVIFGNPIPWQTFDKQKSPAEWAREVKNFVYQLPEKPDMFFK